MPKNWRYSTVSVDTEKAAKDIVDTLHENKIPIAFMSFVFDRTKEIAISIHALRAEGDFARRETGGIRPFISIHALRAEGDIGKLTGDYKVMISIHALRAEGDIAQFDPSAMDKLFQSTPSMRRATFYLFAVAPCDQISIHVLRAEGDARKFLEAKDYPEISIHALRAEGDAKIAGKDVVVNGISIHALRAEGDMG